MDKEDPQQIEAIHAPVDKDVLCLAGAGSGKTHVLVERIAYLINDCKVSPYEIMAVSFTRKASGELRERIEKRLGPGAHHITMGTIHSIALRFLRRFGDLLGWKAKHLTVYSQFEEDFLLKEVATDLGVYNGKSWKPPKREIQAMFDTYYQEGEIPPEDHPCRRVFDELMLRCRENNSLTYGGLLIAFRSLIPHIIQYLNFKHIFVDEVQDLDALQHQIFKMLSTLCKASLYYVGDLDQCQPSGTKVKILKKKRNGQTPSEFGSKDISELTSEDKVISWTKHDQRTYFVGRKIKVCQREYFGRMLSIFTNGKMTKVTPNHWLWVRFNKKAINQQIVYLMWRENFGFRIGRSQIRTPHGAISLNVRARIERAQRSWILKCCYSRKEAQAWEQVISLKYRIPYSVFETNGCLSQKEISLIFNEMKGFNGGQQCLDDYGLLFEFPFLSYPMETYTKFHGYFKMAACNLIPGIMELPTEEINRSAEIDSIHSDLFKGKVYSLDVEQDHTYIADGIPVGNSAYQWRGAVPEYLINHHFEFQVFKIESNYRSCPEIVKVANKLIGRNTMRLPRTMNATREDAAGIVSVYRDMDSEKIVQTIKQIGLEGKDIAILGRNHFLLRKVSTKLDEAGMSYTYIGRESEFVESLEFRTFHAFLKLLVNPYDNFSMLLIRDLLGIPRKEYNGYRLRAAKESKSHFQTWYDSIPSGVNPKRDFFYDTGRPDFDLEETVRNLCVGFEWGEEVVAIDAFIRAYQQSGTDQTVGAYLDWLSTYDLQDEVKDEDEKMKLISIHSAKGLEWACVMVIGLNEGILPSKQSIEAGEDEIEKERNLMYIACTRARDALLLAVRPERKEDERGKVYENPESRFVKEML